jgi:hypothetical protein
MWRTLARFVAHYGESLALAKSFTVFVVPSLAPRRLWACIVDVGGGQLLVHRLSES